MLYRRLSFSLPQPAEELLADRLWALGTLGLEMTESESEGGGLRLDAWFTEPPPSPVAATEWLPPGVELVESAAVEEEDWMAAYRHHARPIRLAGHITIDPRDQAKSPTADETSDGLWLHLPARRAFGTGSHASTRLAVELLVSLPLAGRTVLDLGTGTGVLALIALAAGARFVAGLDNDPVAALIAGENGVRNRLCAAVAAGRIGCLRRRPLFDVVLVNILPHLVFDELGEIATLLRPGGTAIFSGLLEVDRRRYVGRLGELGITVPEHRSKGDWVALRGRRQP